MKRSRLPAIAAFLFIGIASNAYMARQAWLMTHFDAALDDDVPAEGKILSGGFKAAVIGVRLPRARNRRTPADVGLSYETHKFSAEGGRELEAWYIPAKRSRGIVAVFHGFGRSKANHLSTARQLHDLGYDSLLVDFYGYGGSAGSYSTIGWLEALDVAAAAKHARALAGGKPVVLLGTSMGAAAVLRAVSMGAAKPDGVVLESSYLRFIDSVRRRFQLMSFPIVSPFAEWVTFWGGRLYGFNAFSMNPIEWARDVKVPALVLTGEKDRTISVEEERRLYDALPGRKAWHSFPELGHAMFSEHAPEDWRASVEPFLKSL